MKDKYKYKYIKVFEGVVTGSMAGRDDGQPTTCHAFFETDEELVNDPDRKDQRIYWLDPVDEEEMVVIRKRVSAEGRAAALKAAKLRAKEKEEQELAMLAKLKAKYERPKERNS